MRGAGGERRARRVDVVDEHADARNGAGCDHVDGVPRAGARRPRPRWRASGGPARASAGTTGRPLSAPSERASSAAWS